MGKRQRLLFCHRLTIHGTQVAPNQTLQPNLNPAFELTGKGPIP